MKAYTDIEQSKKLAEMLPIESADMRYLPSISEVPFIWSVKQMQESEAIPAWSLSALLDVLPKGTRLLKSSTDDIYHCDCPKCNIDEWFDNPVDACYDMILKLHELRLL